LKPEAPARVGEGRRLRRATQTRKGKRTARVIGKHYGKRKILKLMGTFWRAIALTYIVRKEKIDIAVPTNETLRIQECHILVGHALCDAVEQAIATAPVASAAVK